MTTTIKSNKLTKKYGRQVALDQVSIQVEQGDIYGLIGRNGAGKTTLLKILSQQIHPDSGTFEVFGEEVQVEKDNGIRIGSIIESPGLYPDLTAYQNMMLKCEAMGIHRKNYIEDILDLVGLADVVKKKRTKQFSLGMKQRLGLALALIGDPDILLLDEPTNGMDPQGISDFRNLILKLNQERKITIIISSHILSELDKIVNKLGIIHEGRLLTEVTRDELLNENRDKLVLTSNQLSRVTNFIEEELKITDFLVVNPTELEIYESIDQPEYISHNLIENGILFDTFYYHENSLEEYYINLTGGGQHA